MSKKALIIWFDDKGRLLNDAGSFVDMTGRTTNWKATYTHEEAKDFDDLMDFLQISDYYRGHARVSLKSVVTGRTYTMFASDFNDVIVEKRFTNNQIKGTFRFMKKGQAQTIRLLSE